MQGMLHSLAHFFFALGGLGLFFLGILDSSFLMMPLGNDLLLTVLVAENSSHLIYYVLMATAGSVLGVAFAHLVSSHMGRKALEGEHKSRTVAYVESKVEKYGGLAIGIAALAPPGFPFTPFIVVPAALQYPRGRMLIIIGACRLVRFGVEGWLAMRYGKRVLEMAKTPLLQYVLGAVVIISIAGSAFSIWGWVKKGRRKEGTTRPAARPSPAA